tara:strand:- start:22 stop:459 length:438 start_codon:yes stop_codon:yes gene_type:complete
MSQGLSLDNPQKPKRRKVQLLSRREDNIALEESLEARGSLASVNSSLAAKADIRILPSVHTIVSNAYVVIANEVQRLSFRSSMSPLSSSEARTFEKMTTALARLVGVEQDIKEESALSGISDEALLEAADAAREKLTSKKKGQAK